VVDAHTGGAISILVVDDDMLDFEWVETLLKRITNYQINVTWIQTFPEAEQALNDNKFDMALIDIAIGPHSGVDLLSSLGGREFKTPMVMLTNNDTHENDVSSMNAGAYDYLNKGDINPEILERTLRYVIETRRLENELKIARDSARAASEAKSTFLSNMSHDLRTPLNTVIGFSELMLNCDKLEPNYKEHLSLIHASGQHLASMISDLILLAQFEGNDIRITGEECDIANMVPSIVGATRYAAKHRNIIIHCEITENLPMIHGDQMAIHRMLMNLMASACDLAEVGQCLKISSREQNEGVSFEIVGPCEKLSEVPLMQMAEPLQVPNSEYAAESIYRVGLSLAIAYRYAELHSATLEVAPLPSGEMCFSVFFPMKLKEKGQLPHQKLN
jgi:signal transduction histidine kinase